MRSDRRVALGVALAFFGFYLLTVGAERPWGDGRIQAALAERLWTTGQLDLPDEPRGRYVFEGPDGRAWSTFSLGVALSLGPSVLARRLLAPDHRPAIIWGASHRTSNALWAALTLALFFLLARRLAVSRRRALWGTLALGLATQHWVYAHSDFSESYQSFAVLAAVSAALHAAGPDRRGGAASFVWLGLAWGHLLIAKVVYAAVMPLGLWYVWRGLKGDPTRLRRLGLALAVAAPFAGLFLGYNLLRTGDWLGTGRQLDHHAGPLSGSLWIGTYGLLLSSGKGLLIFNPLLLLSLGGARAFAARWRREAWLIGGLCLTLFAVYARYVFWHGAWSFGPRFLTCLVPLLALPLLWLPPLTGLARAAALGLALSSAGVQLLGCAYYAGHHIHANNNLRRALWGTGPRDHCGWCHENHYLAHFVPQASPIAIHAWLLSHHLRGTAPEDMGADAPWAVDLPVEQRAAVAPIRPPLDLLISRASARQPPALALLGLGLLALLAAAAITRRRPRDGPT